MIHRPRALTTMLVALVLSAAMPAAAIQAGDPTTPLNTNLLRNGRFGTVNENEAIPGWKVEGDVHVERFGTDPWPNEAYGKKWGGGSRYLTCGTRSGMVSQKVAITHPNDRPRKKAQVEVDFGGTTGHKIRASVRATGGEVDAYVTKTKTLEVTNHYKVIVAAVADIPAGTTHLEVEIELIRKSGASKCKMVADTVSLVITQP